MNRRTDNCQIYIRMKDLDLVNPINTNNYSLLKVCEKYQGGEGLFQEA